MQELRDKLTLAIEAISVITAIGIVISAFTYSVVFGMVGISYLGVVTLGDVLRDSMQFLILWIMVSLIFIPTLTVTDYIWTKRTAVGPKRHYLIIGLGCSLVAGLLVYGAAWLLTLVSGKAYRAGEDLPWWAIVAVAALFMMNWLWGMYRPVRRQPTSFIVGLIITAVGVVGATGNSIWDTMKADLAADVYPVDPELCGGKYTVLWLGESRMVARCDRNKHVVVKVLS